MAPFCFMGIKNKPSVYSLHLFRKINLPDFL